MKKRLLFAILMAIGNAFLLTVGLSTPQAYAQNAPASANAPQTAVVPAPVFCDHMVLQRDMSVPVWGTAAPGQTVTVKFAGQSVSTVADANGKWMLKLAPLATNAAPQVMTINDLQINDILVGEVWLCSGQSNMEMPLWGGNPRFRNNDGDAIAAKSANPMIRVSRMVPYGWSKLPQSTFKMSWNQLTPETAIPMSAVAFFYGQVLQKALQIPIGLITSHWGGTRIEPWTPPCGFDSVPELASIAEAVNAKLPGHPVQKNMLANYREALTQWIENTKGAEASGTEILPPPAFPTPMQPWDNHQNPTVLYNHMIAPFVPFAIRGAIWYQGCSNRGEDMLYKYKMQALFNGWKQVFANPDLKFYFVQLAPFRYGNDPEALPRMWEAQEAFTKENEPQVGMAVINDVGDFNDIHPHNKLPVGLRLATLALNRTYGFKNINPDFPICTKHAIVGNTYVLSFANVTKWQTTDNLPIQDFQIAGIDGIYRNATVTIKGTDLIVSAPEVKEPKHIRYLWNQTLAGKLFNERGLPLGGFRFLSEITEKDVKANLDADWKLVYEFSPFTPIKKDIPPTYTVNNAETISGDVARVAYFVRATDKNGVLRWVLATMDAFTAKASQCGIPVKDSFQTKISNLNVLSNVPGLKTGFYSEGNIEFWPSNYATQNSTKIPGADDRSYDCGDSTSAPAIGYGSMQIHAFTAKTTVFAFNNFFAQNNADFGIGNNPDRSNGQHPDWTFAKNLARDWKDAVIRVYVITK